MSRNTKEIKFMQEKKEQKNNDFIVCVHCHREITTIKLLGISVVCPYCGKPSDESITKDTKLV